MRFFCEMSILASQLPEKLLEDRIRRQEAPVKIVKALGFNKLINLATSHFLPTFAL